MTKAQLVVTWAVGVILAGLFLREGIDQEDYFLLGVLPVAIIGSLVVFTIGKPDQRSPKNLLLVAFALTQLFLLGEVRATRSAADLASSSSAEAMESASLAAEYAEQADSSAEEAKDQAWEAAQFSEAASENCALAGH